MANVDELRKDLELIPFLMNGRDRRFKRDSNLGDLRLYRWAIDQGYDYDYALGLAVKEFCLKHLKPEDYYHGVLSRCSKESLPNNALSALATLDLQDMGFQSPVQNSALINIVYDFLKARKAL